MTEDEILMLNAELEKSLTVTRSRVAKAKMTHFTLGTDHGPVGG